MNMSNALKRVLVCGFPGTGKSWFKDQSPDAINVDLGMYVYDSDSSNFSWLNTDPEQPKVRNPAFPSNYMDYIQDINYGLIFISTHAVVREALANRTNKFIIVYPDISLKEEYIQRYINRGSPDSFITLMNDKWDEWITELDELDHPYKIKLTQGQYIKDIAQDIVNFQF